MVNIGNDWDQVLVDEFKKEYYLKLREFLKSEYRSQQVFPDMHDIFNALKYTSYEGTKVLILGQDPWLGLFSKAGYKDTTVPFKYVQGAEG